MDQVGINRAGALETKSSVRWKSIAPTLLVMWIIGMFDKIGVAVIATNKQFLSDMGILGHNALIGSLVSVMLVSYGVSFFFWGWIVDKWGPKNSAIVGLIGWAISTFLAAVSPGFGMLLFSRVLLGLFEGFLWPVSNALTARWFPLSERGRAKSIWINGTNIGPAFAGFLVIALMGSFHWRGVFWFLTAFAIVICLPMVIFLIKNLPSEDSRVSQSELDLITSEQIKKEDSEGGKKKSTMKTGAYWLVVFAAIINVFGIFGLMAWFPSYLRNVKHFSPNATSTYELIGFGAALLLTIWVGSHTDKTHRKAVWTIWGFILGAVTLYIAATVSSPVESALFLCASIAFINGITTPMIHGMIHSMSDTFSIGRNTGVMTGVGNTIGALAPTIMGGLITVAHGNYFGSFLFLIISFIVAGFVGIFTRRLGY